ncbi:MAG: chromosomal replication initiator protein DnaA [Gammaproteobacteria bacterium]
MTESEMQNFWQGCLGRFHGLFGKDIFDAFIAPLAIDAGEDGTMRINAPNEATQRWLADNLGGHLNAWLHEQFPAARPVRYCLKAQTAKTITSPAALVKPAAGRQSFDRQTGLRPDFTFDNFVPGHANEIALAVARKIAAGDVDNCNPFVLHGSTGLGKTHLVQAIGNRYRKLFPRRRVRYINSRDFINEVINACRHKAHDKFRNSYDLLDLLIVDDIQYIGGDKTRTQEEFFFVCNRCSDSGRMIVITSDAAPARIRGLPPRLTSRFAGGLPIAIRPPELELRINILHKKSAAAAVKLDDKVARFIADRVKSSVRELEGAFKRVLAAANFLGKEPSLAICHQALSDLLGPAQTIGIADIQTKVAEYFHLRRTDLTGKRRLGSVVRPRQIAMYLARQTTTMSLPEIGAQFGGRNHATVIHACRVIEEKITSDAQVREDVQTLEMLVKSQ